MESTLQKLKRPKAATSYLLLITILGATALGLALFWLPMPRLDLRLLLLATITILVSSRIAIRIPRANVDVTVTDTFIFLVLLLYGGLAGIVIAATEGLFSGLRISKKPLTVLFNSAMMASSTMLTVTVVSLAFGPVDQLRLHETSHFIAAVSTMTLAQYFATTGLTAIGLALKTGDSIWCAWQKHCLWTSITYLGGAAIAAAVVNIVERIGLVTFVIAAPIIGIIYFIYRKYLGEITATAVQAEQADHLRAQAEQARTEAERERAEQAERHVEELRRHIAEQERISEQLRESKEHFRHAAFHDALTNLPNRALLTENLRFAIERAKQYKAHQFAVLLLDLDRFKNVNDSLGHSHGDQLIMATARRLESCIRECDMVARLSGDEFAVLVDGISDSGAATDMARRIQEQLHAPFSVSGHEVFTTVSIGIALSASGYDHPENMLRDADTAMYRAKAKGKACYTVFDKSMHTHAVFLLQMETDLRRALEREELLVHYQPIVSLDDGHLAGFEALVRWEHPERGVMSPADFIPMAEDTGLIVPLGAFVLRRACQQVSKWHWQSMANRSLFMSVNLSGKQLARPNLLSEIRAILEETHVEPKHLKLEITESAVMENAETGVQLLSQLKAMGVHSIMDDFGTGQSSLGYLHRFPLSTLKIDRSFVGRIGEVAENIEIVRSIIYLAETMGMEVVAEGVETLGQLTQLRQLGCHYGQGFLFSRPVEAEFISEWISRQPPWQDELFKPTRDCTIPQKPDVIKLRRA